MDLFIIAFIESCRHTFYYDCAPVITDQHLFPVFIERDTLYLTLTCDVIKSLLWKYGKLIQIWIDRKRGELDEMNKLPTPIEFMMYYDL